MVLLASLAAHGMLLAGLALMALILLRRGYRYYGPRRRGRKDLTPLVVTPRPEKVRRSLTDAPPDVLRWQVEMHDTARELKAELDSKITVLQVLIRQARQQADRLEQLRAHHADHQADPAMPPAGGNKSTRP